MSDRMHDDGRVVVVTGASRGIGRAVAERLGDAGALVMCVGRDGSALEATADSIRTAAGRATVCIADVTDPDGVDRIAALVRDLGRIDALVNNAGVYAPGSVLDLEADVYRRLFEVNLIGAVNLIRSLVPLMIERGGGRVVNIASTAGRAGSVYQAPYNVSKHALIGLTRCIAQELGPVGVTANAVCPGFVETELFDRMIPDQARARAASETDLRESLQARSPMGRFASTDEVAAVTEFLCLGAADAITGQCVTIDGGMLPM